MCLIQHYQKDSLKLEMLHNFNTKGDYSLTKKRMMMGAMLSSALLLSACSPLDTTIEKGNAYAEEKLSSISVPFEWFKLDEVPEKEATATWAKVEKIELAKKEDMKEAHAFYQEFLEPLDKELTNRETMERFATGNNTSRETFPYFSNLRTSKDVFGEAVRSVYSEPHQYVVSTTLTGIGKTAVNGEVMTVLSVSMNSVNDTEKFLTHDFVMYLNAENNIVDVSLNKESNRSHTVKPLSKDSEWVESTHKDFLFAWKDFLSLPKQEDWKSVDKNMMSSWVSQFGLDDSSTNVLYEWYRMNEGDVTRGQITGYLHTDHEALAETWYEITYPHKNSDDTTSITVVYDRGLNKMIRIQKNSPFTYKGELK